MDKRIAVLGTGANGASIAADLTNANLRHASLEDTDLTNAILIDAKFWHTYIEGARRDPLKFAYLEGTKGLN